MNVRRFAGAATLLALGTVLAGCSGDAQISNKEAAQMKQGPPKEMPAQARQLMEQAKQQPANNGQNSNQPTTGQ